MRKFLSAIQRKQDLTEYLGRYNTNVLSRDGNKYTESYGTITDSDISNLSLNLKNT